MSTNRIYIVLILCLSTVFNVIGQNSSDEQDIKQTILTFFEGMHSGDTAIIATTISPNLKLESTYINKQNEVKIKASGRNEFLMAVAQKKDTDIWLEKLLSFEIHINYPLASVWTPYEFYLNSKYSHCGANSFQLVKIDKEWKIIYLIDSRKKSDCKPTN